MELPKLINWLRKERDKLDQVLLALEDLQRSSTGDEARLMLRKRRGRKSMNATQRQEVSERMKNYWAGRKGALVR